MNCQQIQPYLPGFAGGDLRPDTANVVAAHVRDCASCSAEVARHDRVRAGLATLATREVAPPPFLLEAVLEGVHEHRSRRVLPLIPIPPSDLARIPAELGRIVSENRDAIASATGTALVAAGAAYALWRAVRGSRRAQTATS
jgi:anti-sigma factor RsiW